MTKRYKKSITESDLSFDRMNMAVKGREHAQRIKQLHRTIDHAENLASKHLSHAELHYEIGQDPKHPKHRDPMHHREKYDKHLKKHKLLRNYVDAFKKEMGD